MRCFAITVFSSAALVGCVSTSFLATDSRKVYTPTAGVEVCWEPPERPYMVIGQVTAKSDGRSQEAVFERLKRRAMEEGAHGIIMRGSHADSSVVGVPAAGGGVIIAPASVERLEALAIRFTTTGQGC